MVNYPVGDFLIKIKNAAATGKKDVIVDYSELIYAISLLLKKEKYLSKVEKEGGKLSVKVAYMSKDPVLVQLKLVSKPGKRVYQKAASLRLHRGLSFFIVSTPQGIMTSKEAAKKNLGGEVIAEIH